MAASPASPPLPLLPFHHPWLSPPYFLPLVSGWTVAVPEEEQSRQSSPRRVSAHGPMVRQSPPPQSTGSRANGQAFSREVSSGNEGAKVTWGGLHNKRGKDQLRAFDTGGTQDPVSLAAQSSLKQVHRALLISVLPAQAWPSPGGTGAQSNNQAGRTRIHQNSRRPSLSCLSLFQTNQTGQNPNSRLEGKKWG